MKPMKKGQAVELLSFHDLSEYGENSVDFYTDSCSDLFVTISYGTGLEEKILFNSSTSFYVSAWPCPNILNISEQNETKLGSLLVYPDSEAASAWVSYWNKSFFAPSGKFLKKDYYKHYEMIFPSAKMMIVVFAANYGLAGKEPPEFLFYGTASHIIYLHINNGLTMDYVCLTEDIQTAINDGSRYGEPAVLKILAHPMYEQGFIFFHGADGVWLTNEVPPQFIQLFRQDENEESTQSC